MNYRDLDAFTRGYIECAIWASTDDEGEPLDGRYSADDLDESALLAMVRDCDDFQESQAVLLRQAERAHYTDEYAGQDFWLSRNGHGAGFWDRGLGEVGDRLHEAAKVYGSASLYEGHTAITNDSDEIEPDGWLYHFDG